MSDLRGTLSPDAQRLEHLIRARNEVIAAMRPVNQRTTYVDGQIGAITGLLNDLIDLIQYP